MLFGLSNGLMSRMDPEDADILLQERLDDSRPLMVARFGAVEIKSLIYSIMPSPLNLILRGYTYKRMHNNAGFFPLNDKALIQFKDLMMADMQELDILCSWRPEELIFRNKLRHCKKASLKLVGGPNDSPDIWTQALKGKRILVVHPFAETIERQYKESREHLFNSPLILPEYASLVTVKAAQTIAGNNAGYASWFDALEDMKSKIDSCEYDVALIGCGAYGFPLAAHVKRQGKKAIHIGGPLQLYFGIKGKRWENLKYINEYWVSPSDNEKPENLQKVEGGCYW